MKKLLKDKLLAKYQGVLKKLTPKGLELLIDKLSTKVTTEDEIEDFVNGLENVIEPFVDTIQAETDRRIKEEVDKTKTKVKKSVEDDDPKEDVPNNDETVPAWAKGLQDTVKTLTEKLANEQSRNAKLSFVELAKAKGIPEKIASMYTPAEGADSETSLTELESIWSETKQAEINKSTGDGRTQFGTPTPGDKEVSTAITEFAKKNVEQNTKKD